MNTHDKLTQDPKSDVTQSLKDWVPLDVDLSAASHRGHVRENNEDSYIVLRFGRSLQNLSTNLDDQLIDRNYDITGHGMLVADGMGGMAAGEIASQLAVARLIDLIVETSDWILSLKKESDMKRVLQRMTQRFHQIDETLREEAEADSRLYGMGTTLTVAGVLGSNLILGHVGDSRAYVLRGNSLKQLTRDHTLAQALIDAGVANRDDPATRSMKHVLTAAMGSMGDRLEPQVQRFTVCSGDQLLLCTDGLTDMVNDETIAKVLLEGTSAENSCKSLIDLALAAGGVDNVTAVVARFESPIQR
jgi:serine/threonine protein phosphatase PrpC